MAFCLSESPWLRPEAVASAVAQLLKLPEVRSPYAYLRAVLPGRHLRACEEALELESAGRRKR